MTLHPDLAQLEAQRARLRADLAAVGDFRPGSVSAVMRRCGKANCACADAAHPGHGPQHVLTRKVGGKTVTLHLRPGPELAKVSAEVGNYRRFRQIVGQLIEINEAICAARAVVPVPVAGGQERDAGTDGEKGGSSPRSRKRSRPR